MGGLPFGRGALQDPKAWQESLDARKRARIAEARWVFDRVLSAEGDLKAGVYNRVDPQGVDFTVYLPKAALCKGQSLAVKLLSAPAAAITVQAASGDTVDGGTTLSLTNTIRFAELVSDGDAWL